MVPAPTFAEPFAPAVASVVPEELRARTLPKERPLAMDPTDCNAAVLTVVQMVNVNFEP